MGKDLTTSRIDRQNILNNELAIEEMHNSVDTKMVFWNDKYYLIGAETRNSQPIKCWMKTIMF